MNFIALRQNTLKLSGVIINTLRKASTKDTPPEVVSWSTGEKQKPLSWRHDPDMWYRRDDHLLHPHPLDPKDPKQIYPYKRDDGGIQYFNFVYYPRHPDEKDPEFEVTPLLFVHRIKKLKHTTWWEKKIIKKLNLDEYGKGQKTVVKNTPEMNAMLWQVKHLVKIVPLRFPKDAPKDDENPFHYLIQLDGEVIYVPSVTVTETDLITPETALDKNWVTDHVRNIYYNSLKLEF